MMMTPFGILGLGRMLSIGAICFEDRFCAVLVGCRKALVDTRWTISHLVSINGRRTLPFPCPLLVLLNLGNPY